MEENPPIINVIGGKNAECARRTFALRRINMHKIIVISDYVCPYCYVAEEALKQASKGREDIVTEFHPYELTRKPAPQVDTYHDGVRRERWAAGLVPDAKRLGMDVHFPPCVVPRPYTHLAAEGFLYARERGKGDAYNEAVFAAYFTEEQDIGKLEALKKAAEEAGLDGAEFEAAMEAGTYAEAVEQERSMTEDITRIAGLPTILIDGHKAEIERYTLEAFKALLEEADRRQAEGETEEDVCESCETAQEEEEDIPAGGCGDSGCFF